MSSLKETCVYENKDDYTEVKTFFLSAMMQIKIFPCNL